MPGRAAGRPLGRSATGSVWPGREPRRIRPPPGGTAPPQRPAGGRRGARRRSGSPMAERSERRPEDAVHDAWTHRRGRASPRPPTSGCSRSSKPPGERAPRFGGPRNEDDHPRDAHPEPAYAESRRTRPAVPPRACAPGRAGRAPTPSVLSRIEAAVPTPKDRRACTCRGRVPLRRAPPRRRGPGPSGGSGGPGIGGARPADRPWSHPIATGDGTSKAAHRAAPGRTGPLTRRPPRRRRDIPAVPLPRRTHQLRPAEAGSASNSPEESS